MYEDRLINDQTGYSLEEMRSLLLMMRNEKTRVAILSLLASLSITIMNLIAWLITNSLAVLAETMHTALDVLVTAITLTAVSVGSKPPDREHPYGHGKAESIGGFLGSLFIIITGILIGYESAERLIMRVPFSPDPVAAVVMAIAVVIDINRSRALRRAAIKWNSRALEADSYHFMSDIAVSSSVIVLIIVGKVMDVVSVHAFDVWGTLLDSLFAFGIVIYFSMIGVRLIRTSIDELMDRISEDLVKRAREAALSVPGVLSVKDVKARRAGSMAHVEITIGVSDNLSISEAHGIADKVESAISQKVGPSIIMVHVEPELVESELKGRIERVLSSISDPLLINIHNLEVMVLPEGDVVVTMHVVVKGDSELESINHVINKIEREVRSVVPNARVWIHIEPEKEVVNVDEIRRAASAVSSKYGGYVSDVQVVSVSGTNIVRVLVYLPSSISVALAHDIASEIEGEVAKTSVMPHHVIISVLPKG